MKYAALALALPALLAAREPPPDTRPVVHRVIPRDAIPAIHDPQFVPVKGSGLGPGDAVLGFSHQGETHLYALDLLNHHEIVNDEVGGLPVAATW